MPVKANPATETADENGYKPLDEIEESFHVDSNGIEEVDSKTIFPFGLVVEVAERDRFSSTFNEDLKLMFPALEEADAPPVLEMVTAPLYV